MLIGIIGDTHYTNKTPMNRKDNIWETQIRKTEQAFRIFMEKGCRTVLQTGDLFDKPGTPVSVISDTINLFKSFVNFGGFIGLTFGQHDIYGHSGLTLPNSPLSILQAAEVVSILSNEPIIQLAEEEINIYGAGFGADIPTPTSQTSYDILVTHRMIGNRQLYPNQELENPIWFLKQHPQYDLVVCGDYHYRFISTYEGRTIINPGALIRKSVSKSDLEHKPAVVIFDTDHKQYEVVELDITPSDEVFDLSVKSESGKSTEALNAFIETLKRNGVCGGQEGVAERRWKQTLVKVMNERNSSDGARDVIDKALEAIGGM